jgi:hypothetical protein
MIAFYFQLSSAPSPIIQPTSYALNIAVTGIQIKPVKTSITTSDPTLSHASYPDVYKLAHHHRNSTWHINKCFHSVFFSFFAALPSGSSSSLLGLMRLRAKAFSFPFLTWMLQPCSFNARVSALLGRIPGKSFAV